MKVSTPFLLSMSFSFFDNVGSLKSVRLHGDLSGSSKSPRNLVRRSCLLRPLFSAFSALSLHVVVVEGNNQAVNFYSFANNIAIFGLPLNYFSVIVKARVYYPECSIQITLKITQF